MWYEVFAREGDAKKTTAICNLRRRYQEIASRRQAKSCKLIAYIPPQKKGVMRRDNNGREALPLQGNLWKVL